MRKSGAKLIGIGFVMTAVGVVCGYSADSAKGSMADNLIRASVVLCIGGVAVFLYGLVKLVAGVVKRA